MIKPMVNTKFGEIAIKNARRAHHGDPSTTKNKSSSKNISAIMSLLYRKSELKTRIMLQGERNCKIRAGWLDYENRGLKAQNKKLRALFGVEE